AVAFLRARDPNAPAWSAGFSFGAWIAARLGASDPSIERLVLIAPPVTTSSFEVLHSLETPKHVFQGTADDVCPPGALTVEFQRWAEPRHLRLIEGANHFFDKRLGALSEAMVEELKNPA